jgi:anti-sigma-K factor RskA
MTERDDIDVMAGEYVLGTLEESERAAVSARRRREAALDAAIEAWEQRLSPLNEGLSPAPPPPGLLGRIEARIDAGGSAGTAPQLVVHLRRRARAWRSAAIAASALAACLMVAIGLRELSRPSPAKTYVAVFQKDDASPAFLLTVDLGTRTLSVRPVAARPQPGKSYQLWIASDRIGPAPQSLGLIEADGGAVERALAKYDRAVVEKATFGISLEPAGGSPTGTPTGPAFHARLIEAAR